MDSGTSCPPGVGGRDLATEPGEAGTENPHDSGPWKATPSKRGGSSLPTHPGMQPKTREGAEASSENLKV